MSSSVPIEIFSQKLIIMATLFILLLNILIIPIATLKISSRFRQEVAEKPILGIWKFSEVVTSL